jgi:hypothetical protein
MSNDISLDGDRIFLAPFPASRRRSSKHDRRRRWQRRRKSCRLAAVAASNTAPRSTSARWRRGSRIAALDDGANQAGRATLSWKSTRIGWPATTGNVVSASALELTLSTTPSRRTIRSGRRSRPGVRSSPSTSLKEASILWCRGGAETVIKLHRLAPGAAPHAGRHEHEQQIGVTSGLKRRRDHGLP